MTLIATISGKVSGDAMTFLKTYDRQVTGYDAVRYEGVIADEGREIWGAWAIPGNWSGTFIMIRSKGMPIAQQVQHKAERV